MARKATTKKSSDKKSYEQFSRNTQAFIYNMQVNATQRMLDFDYSARRETPSVAAIVNPTGGESLQKFFFGPKEILIPVYKSLARAAEKHGNVDVLISFASFR
ncbi:MAG: ATP citrate synthase, partial [Thermodesulfobacteriota bacterium]|nr:ATP citrate synthase [Thermodesulfobacteriota bacterium]